MRWHVLLVAAGLGLVGCGDDAPSEQSEAANAELLDPATVDAILGADIPPEEFEPANAADENAVADNASAADANETE